MVSQFRGNPNGDQSFRAEDDRRSALGSDQLDHRRRPPQPVLGDIGAQQHQRNTTQRRTNIAPNDRLVVHSACQTRSTALPA